MAKKSSFNFSEDWLKQKGFVEKDGVFVKPSKFPEKVRNSSDIVKNEFPVPIYDEPTIVVVNKQTERWSEEDIILLKLFYEQKKDIKFISEKLQKKPKAVKSNASSLKITSNPDYTFLEKETIIYYYEHVSKKDFNFLIKLSELLNRPKENISRFARRLGLTSYGRKKTTLKECKVCGIEMSLTGHLKTKNKVCSDKCLSELSSKNIKDRINKNGHPKGMLGKSHSEENKIKQSNVAKEFWNKMSEKEKNDFILKRQKTKEQNGTLVIPRAKTTWKQGWRNIGGYEKYYRSKWEANYARYLEFLKKNGEIKNWFHEPQTFWFEDILRGCRSYLPDFLIIQKDGSEEYHEVKGWMDDRSKTKMKRMAKYYPNVIVKLIQSDWFKSNNMKFKSIINGWE